MNKNEILKNNGFESYDQYLSSELWQKIRNRTVELKGEKCCCCDNKFNNIHHKYYHYNNLIEPKDDVIEKSLFPVCRPCHEKIHFKHSKFRSMLASKHSLNAKMKNKKMKLEKKLGGKTNAKAYRRMLRDGKMQDEYFRS
jgi:hypothetical protein